MKNIIFLLLCLLQLSCSGQLAEKINGISFVASRQELAQVHIQEVMNIHANHAAIMPFGFIRDPKSPEIIHNTERQWFGETKRGAKQYIEMLHASGIKVMIKPQIWISNGVFTGTLSMDSEQDWKALEVSYESFITTYAELAAETNTDVFCIGTELAEFAKNRPEFWKVLIKKIKAVYSGKLTYAANWDEYSRTTFWEDLDYIGIDAYFPLSDSKTPTVEELREGWQKWKLPIQELSKAKKKPVLFTEFGYRSMDYTAKKPWLVDRHDEIANFDAQVNATKALFEEFWNEDWFVGGYVWKWFIDHNESGGMNDNQFTPQNKPCQKVIAAYYERFK